MSTPSPAGVFPDGWGIDMTSTDAPLVDIRGLQVPAWFAISFHPKPDSDWPWSVRLEVEADVDTQQLRAYGIRAWRSVRTDDVDRDPSDLSLSPARGADLTAVLKALRGPASIDNLLKLALTHAAQVVIMGGWAPVRRLMTDEHLQEVAEVYLAAPGSPVQAVVKRFKTSRATASRWVAAAREAGLLPPTKQGGKS